MGNKGLNAIASLSLLAALCACSRGATKTASDTAPPPTGNPTPAPTPLVSTVSTCAGVTGPCAQVDFSSVTRSIPSDLFGDGIEWDDYGQDVINPDLTNQTSGTPRPDVMGALGGVGFTLMRYPGGTLADLFHWQKAIGSMSSRVAQGTMSVDTSNAPLTQLPYFGPDEFARFAGQLGTGILLTVNVATGTASEAAGWISHWEANGVFPKYVEIGNETYLPGPGNSFGAWSPQNYAAAFNSYAAAIRAVDPGIKLGMIGTMDTSSWCYPNCTAPAPWNQVVLQALTQKADFFAIHNAYAPGTASDGQSVYQAMLSFPNFSRFDDSLIEADINLFGGSLNKGLPIATTEFASFFLTASTDPQVITTDISRNQTWAAALYSALIYQGFILDKRCTIANHINPLSPFWQAAITMAAPGTGYPGGYVGNPTESAFGLVFQAYRELAGQNATAITLTGSPTITTQPVGMVPELDNYPLLDAISAVGTSPQAAAKGWLFLANRSLTSSSSVPFVLSGIPAGATTLEIQVLTAPNYLAKNLPGATPAVQWQTQNLGLLPAGSASFGTTVTLPPYSLVRVRVR